MKGMALLQIFIILAVSLFVILFMASPLQDSVDEAIESSAELRLTDIAGVINRLMLSPDKTTYTYTLPRGDCTLNLDEYSVSMAVGPLGKRKTFSYDILTKDSVKISPSIVSCSTQRDMEITFVREDGKIEMR